jgi:hypothetical protein
MNQGIAFLAGWSFLQVAVIVLIIWLSWRFFDRRYKKNEPPPKDMYTAGLTRTSEVFVDPKDGVTYRVYYDPTTGERHYIEEK